MDDNIDAKDALLALRVAVGKTEIYKDLMEAADLNGDDQVNAGDALLMLKYAVGKIKTFPKGDAMNEQIAKLKAEMPQPEPPGFFEG